MQLVLLIMMNEHILFWLRRLKCPVLLIMMNEVVKDYGDGLFRQEGVIT